MARSGKQAVNYSDELKKLREDGPERLYILWGEEDFLRDSFLSELKRQCMEEGEEAFNFHQFQGASLDIVALRDAVDAMPFMGERTLIEVRDFDINKTSSYDGDMLKTLVGDIPDWATVAFAFPPGYGLDSHLGVVKAVKKAGRDMEFGSPREEELVRWVARRAEDQGKTISNGTASYLLWVCGSHMNTLVPEITKIAGAAAGHEIMREDIDAVAKRASETTVFNLTDALGEGKYDKAAALLADLLADPDEPPEKQIALVSEQFRRLYVSRVAKDEGLGDDYIVNCIPALRGKSYPLRLLKKACGHFTREQLARAVCFCAECDYGMKNNGPSSAELMKELVLRLSMDSA